MIIINKYIVISYHVNFFRQEVSSKRNYPRVILFVEPQMFIAQVLQLIFTTLELHIKKIRLLSCIYTIHDSNVVCVIFNSIESANSVNIFFPIYIFFFSMLISEKPHCVGGAYQNFLFPRWDLNDAFKMDLLES